MVPLQNPPSLEHHREKVNTHPAQNLSLYSNHIFLIFAGSLNCPCKCFPLLFFSMSLASTPEEMREEKKEQEGEKGATSEESRAAKAKASKPLMPTSTILRLLAELVRSYVGIATLITSYNYTAGQSELIKEVSHIGVEITPKFSGQMFYLQPQSRIVF